MNPNGVYESEKLIKYKEPEEYCALCRIRIPVHSDERMKFGDYIFHKNCFEKEKRKWLVAKFAKPN